MGAEPLSLSLPMGADTAHRHGGGCENSPVLLGLGRGEGKISEAIDPDGGGVGALSAAAPHPGTRKEAQHSIGNPGPEKVCLRSNAGHAP